MNVLTKPAQDVSDSMALRLYNVLKAIDTSGITQATWDNAKRVMADFAAAREQHQALPVGREVASDWPSYNAAVAEYVEDYEFMGETEDAREGCYSPNERERMLILDAMNGFELLPPAGADTERLNYIERTFGGCSNQERYLPLRMLWGNGANGRTLRDACDKYMSRDADSSTTDRG